MDECELFNLLHSFRNPVFANFGGSLQQSFAVEGIHIAVFVGDTIGYLGLQLGTDSTIVRPVPFVTLDGVVAMVKGLLDVVI